MNFNENEVLQLVTPNDACILFSKVDTLGNESYILLPKQISYTSVNNKLFLILKYNFSIPM